MGDDNDEMKELKEEEAHSSFLLWWFRVDAVLPFSLNGRSDIHIVGAVEGLTYARLNKHLGEKSIP
jgi:hypothetical protein